MLKTIIEKINEEIKIPLYSALIVDKKTENKINSLLPQPKDFDDEYHVTICYSKKPVKISKELIDKKDFPFEGQGKVINWTIFESEKYGKSFVLILDCPCCKEKFNKFIKMGASFDYEKYIPHLTLYYDLPKNINPEDLFKKFKDINIYFDKIRYEKIDNEKYLK
jgi:2'-5' RNA ligase